MGRLSRDKGARFEREVAKALGTERTGTRGKADKEHADVVHPRFFVQCKRRAKLSISSWWKETSEGATKAGKTPILVVREDRGEALAVMRLEDFGKLREAQR
jgi:hypothetical protein